MRTIIQTTPWMTAVRMDQGRMARRELVAPACGSGMATDSAGPWYGSEPPFERAAGGLASRAAAVESVPGADMVFPVSVRRDLNWLRRLLRMVNQPCLE